MRGTGKWTDWLLEPLKARFANRSAQGAAAVCLGELRQPRESDVTTFLGIEKVNGTLWAKFQDDPENKLPRGFGLRHDGRHYRYSPQFGLTREDLRERRRNILRCGCIPDETDRALKAFDRSHQPKATTGSITVFPGLD